MSVAEIKKKSASKKNYANFAFIAESRKLDIENVKEIFFEALKHIFLEIDQDVELEKEWVDEGETLIVKAPKIIVSDEEFEEELAKAEKKSDLDTKDLYLITYIPLSRALKLDKKAVVDDTVVEAIEYQNLSQARVRKIQNLFQQNLSKATKDRIYLTYKDRIGEAIKVKIENITEMLVTISIVGDSESVTFIRTADLKKKYPEIKVNGVYEVFITDVLAQPKKNGSMIMVSTTSPFELLKLLESTFPEIASKEILVKRIARRAGVRSKIAVMANPDLAREDLDVIGILIGQQGSKSQALSSELGEEKLDFITFSEDRLSFMLDALKPARVISISEKQESPDQYAYEIVVPDAMVSVAIGKGGINTYLASEITRSRVNVKGYTDALAAKQEILWNANVTEDELEQLNTFSLTNKRVQTNRSQSNYSKTAKPKRKDSFDISDFNKDIEAFDSYFESIKDTQGAGPADLVTKEAPKVKAKPAKDKDVIKEDNYYDVDFAEINAAIEAASFDELDQEIDSDFEEQVAIKDKETAEKERQDRRTKAKLQDYAIKDNDFADFALDGIDLDNLDDEDWD
ncbi:hypothetical protein CJJ23_01790 [Mycoplasmopsis agassizii]|uniref:Uncharacterized protein n=1 Tax=Mycoplasmopsis agassizii TaxID=33922 RepID=A0A269TJ75_9BACT|nr:hypothetical protein [Mycoplasmopsis agassizii]PAK21504.1 hypothetical protein CJJ23_01790 [Mycoplasmopsis agassizii]